MLNYKEVIYKRALSEEALSSIVNVISCTVQNHQGSSVAQEQNS